MEINYTYYGCGLYFVGHNADELGPAIIELISRSDKMHIKSISGKDVVTITNGKRAGQRTCGYFVVLDEWR